MITNQELDKGVLTLKLIWSAMLLSLAIYLFVGLQVVDNVRSSMDEGTFGVVKTAFCIIALAVLIVTRYVRKMVLSGKWQTRPPADAGEVPAPSRHPALQTYTTATILALAMSESIGVCGLFLFFLGKNPMDLYLLLLISAAAMFMYRPSREELITLSRKWDGDPTSGGARG